jgi:hypothetical protein
MSRIESASFSIVDSGEVIELGVTPVVVGVIENSASTKFLQQPAFMAQLKLEPPPINRVSSVCRGLIDMTRHVKVISKKSYDGNVETVPAVTFAKAIFDTVNTKTVISVSPVNIYRNPGVVIIYDD